MTFRLTLSLRIAALCAAAIVGLIWIASAATAAPSQSKPLPLSKFMRKPIATAATRAVKTRDGSYRQVSASRVSPPHRGKRTGVTQPQIPELSAEAAQAFASDATAQVQVVASNEVNEIDLAADAAPLVPVRVFTQHVVQQVGADEFNEIDRQADPARAVSLDELSRKLTAAATPEPSEAETKSWLQRLLLVLGGAFAAASAAARLLLG